MVEIRTSRSTLSMIVAKSWVPWSVLNAAVEVFLILWGIKMEEMMPPS